MPRQNVYDMPFTRVYEALVAKAEKNGRNRSEVDQIIKWLTGYVSIDILDGLTYGQFLSLAPAWNPKSEAITGVICGVSVEEITDSMERKMRQLDKLVDDLAKGKPMEGLIG